MSVSPLRIYTVFHTEAELQGEDEWARVGRLFDALQTDDRFQIIRPGQVLDLIHLPGAGNRLVPGWRLAQPGIFSLNKQRVKNYE